MKISHVSLLLQRRQQPVDNQEALDNQEAVDNQQPVDDPPPPAPADAHAEQPEEAREETPRASARPTAAQSAAAALARQREATWQQVDREYRAQQSAFASSSGVMGALEKLLKRGEGDQVVRNHVEAINSMLQVKT